MGDQMRTGEAALIRAVRALDQGDPETTPDRLERAWDALEGNDGGGFHAAEEMLLRWLLKNMAGSSANAERIRRYPRVWDILGVLFTLIPLFSLAKSLADRRFVGILQQTLKDISSPQSGADPARGTDSDVEMADAPAPESPGNSRKRKRASAPAFDSDSQRQRHHCLLTAEAAFEAVRLLLSRCEAKSVDVPATHRMGAEHVKSLFSSPAAETVGMLGPWLAICSLAVDKPQAQPLREQSSWLSTFAALWELHLQSSGDASEVATHLSWTATQLLGRLTGTPQQTPTGIEPAIQQRWARDLRRFLTRNLILPARAAFLTGGSLEVVQLAVAVSRASALISFPVLFDLVSKSPLEYGGKSSRKDYETWVQAVFDTILRAAKNPGQDAGLAAVRAMLQMAAERGTPLSASSLRSVCKDYALRPDAYDWSLLLSITRLNPDVFLVTDDGKQLLEQVLDATNQPEALDAEDSTRAARLVVLLAEGYAQARDLSTFVKVWLKHLAPTKPKAGLQSLWVQQELADAVARLVQTSLNTSQLVDVLGWLSAQTGPSEALARIHILKAISSGISHEEYIDAANLRIFEGAFLAEFSKEEPPAVSACRWMVAAETMARGSLEEAGRIWSQIRSDIKSVLRKLPLHREDTFAAFRCCAAAWLANHPGGPHEDDAAKLICSFVERLEKDAEVTELSAGSPAGFVSKAAYVSWILSEAPRLVSLLVEKNDCIPNGILAFTSDPADEPPAGLDSALAVSRLLLERESNVNNPKLMDLLIQKVISMIDTSKAGRKGAATKIAVQFLLDVPAEVLSRSQREAAMKALVSHLPGSSAKAEAIREEYWKAALSLMVKLMGWPTFYEDMSFSHLESIGRCLWKMNKRSSRRSKEEPATGDVSRDRENLRLLQRLAALTLRQMTSGSLEEREKAYIKGAVSVLHSPCEDSDTVPRVVLLQAFLSAIRDSPAAKKFEGDILDLEGIEHRLLQLTLPAISPGKRSTKKTLALLVSLEALSELDRERVRQAVADAVRTLVETSDSLLAHGLQAGWEVRMFLANYFPEALGSPLGVKMTIEDAATPAEDEDQNNSPATLGKMALLRYVDAVVRSADEDARLRYLKQLFAEDDDGQDALGRTLAIYRLIQHLKGSRPSELPDRFDLAQAHSILCRRLQQTTSPPHFLLTAKAVHFLLDQSPACMTQWNIELTLSTVSTISCQPSAQAMVVASPSVYPTLARLVETVIKRHRRRLDGHFHILITALQALLRLLLCRPPPDFFSSSSSSSDLSSPVNRSSHQQQQKQQHPGDQGREQDQEREQERHAKLFARLLTLVCEPTVSSVSRSTTAGGGGGGGGVAAAGAAAAGGTGEASTATAAAAVGPLDSEKDRARRYAGQHMYLVLLQYVRLQLESSSPRHYHHHQQQQQGGGVGVGVGVGGAASASAVPAGAVVVSRRVREALEPGWNSVLDVTTPDGVMRIVSDALDGGGRALFAEMYKRWQRFGKWSGV